MADATEETYVEEQEEELADYEEQEEETEAAPKAADAA